MESHISIYFAKWKKNKNFYAVISIIFCLVLFNYDSVAASTINNYYVYDNSGRLINVFNDSGEVVINEYDPLGNVRNKVVSKGNMTFVDDFNDWNKTYSRSANMQLDGSNPALFEGKTVRASRATNTLEEVVWKQPGIKMFQAIGYHDPGYAVVHPEIQTSMDGVNWKTESPIVTALPSTGWPKYTYTVSSTTGVNFVKLRWMPSNVNCSLQVSKVVMNYDPNVSVM